MSEFDFIPNATAFNLQNAYSLAKAAELAYQDEKEIEKELQKWQMLGQFFEDKDVGTEGFVMSNDQIIVLAFRGTIPNEIKDWLTNLDRELVDGLLDGKVHGGFYTALNSVWPQIQPLIKDPTNKLKSLWVTGHSLGGALATLAVAKFCEEGHPVNGLYTFGQPRVGDPDFAKNFEKKFHQAFRFVNNNDVVTRVPLRSRLGIGEYKHVGQFKYFTEDEQLVDDISRWDRFVDRLEGRLKGRLEDLLEWKTDGLTNHGIDNYKHLVEKALLSEKAGK